MSKQARRRVVGLRKSPTGILTSSLVLTILLMGSMPPAFCSKESTSHSVTVSVPKLLSIKADVGNFTLTFSDFVAGSVTDSKVVTYTVQASNLTRDRGVLTCKVNQLYSGMDLWVDEGSYQKLGGNASLVQSNNGFTKIGVNAANLCDRQIDSGTGKILYGKLPVTYKAEAGMDLDAGDQTRTATVTLTDS